MLTLAPRTDFELGFLSSSTGERWALESRDSVAQKRRKSATHCPLRWLCCTRSMPKWRARSAVAAELSLISLQGTGAASAPSRPPGLVGAGHAPPPHAGDEAPPGQLPPHAGRSSHPPSPLHLPS